jgi:hypothetical protein
VLKTQVRQPAMNAKWPNLAPTIGLRDIKSLL